MVTNNFFDNRCRDYFIELYSVTEVNDAQLETPFHSLPHHNLRRPKVKMCDSGFVRSGNSVIQLH